MSGQPVSPPELERKICEHFIEDHPRSALPLNALMLVAARTHHWLALKRYSVSIQLGTTYPPARRYKPTLRYYGPYVRHLIIGGDTSFDDICDYLFACPTLIDLDRPLTTNLMSLSPADFKEPAFAHITHLDVTSAKRSHWKALSSLPMLSHLAINETVDINILRQLLQRCKRLEILLAVNGGH
ncbi:hypothetical protein BJ912DRAFT_1056364 [Pholiota molesta]|nr:hypothetical protein BJ912DRAFT_1056364 [Pholiota molesta]